jgi:hypothetical protein
VLESGCHPYIVTRQQLHFYNRVLIWLRCLQEAAINRAIGDAETISRKAEATATGIKMVAAAISSHGGADAVSMTVAQQYVEAFGKIAQTGNTIVVPADAGNVSSMVSQATAIFQAMAGSRSGHGPPSFPPQGALESADSSKSSSATSGQSTRTVHDESEQIQKQRSPTSSHFDTSTPMGEVASKPSLFSLQADP